MRHGSALTGESQSSIECRFIDSCAVNERAGEERVGLSGDGKKLMC